MRRKTQAELDELFNRADAQFEAGHHKSAFRLYLLAAPDCPGIGALIAGGTVRPPTTSAQSIATKAIPLEPSGGSPAPSNEERKAASDGAKKRIGHG